jgi:hypothetical protein
VSPLAWRKLGRCSEDEGGIGAGNKSPARRADDDDHGGPERLAELELVSAEAGRLLLAVRPPPPGCGVVELARVLSKRWAGAKWLLYDADETLAMGGGTWGASRASRPR